MHLLGTSLSTSSRHHGGEMKRLLALQVEDVGLPLPRLPNPHLAKGTSIITPHPQVLLEVKANPWGHQNVSC